MSLLYCGAAFCRVDIRRSLPILSALLFNGVVLGSPADWDNTELSSFTVLVTLYSPVASAEWASEKISDISEHDRKMIAMAHEDALSFVASEGGIHGVLLERAFEVLRTHGVKGENVELARMIAAEA
ncbi:DUF2388 domain-containing protein [Pseudomonas delhiensis]|uniref:DUF2388 domain-containing protein n=1 Tax=Pseudomonas delhiensis TaxID=366289 RepID=UPI001113AEEC|nr:DUF2388 domain-containing protein [Pseudomonas delhiensis]